MAGLFITMLVSPSECRAAGEHEIQTFLAARQLDSEGRRCRSMKPCSDADVPFEAVEAEVAPAARDFSRVVENRHVEGESAGNPAPLDRKQLAVAIAEPPAAVAAQRAAAAERRQQEIRDDIVVVDRRLQPAM